MELPTQLSSTTHPQRERRRILLFVYWLTHGGMEQQTINLARAYVAHGDDVTEFGEPGMRNLKADQQLRDDPVNLAAELEHAVGDNPHQPQPPAAIRPKQLLR